MIKKNKTNKHDGKRRLTNSKISDNEPSHKKCFHKAFTDKPLRKEMFEKHITPKRMRLEMIRKAVRSGGVG